jgi:molybdate transport system substrate-binding protein
MKQLNVMGGGAAQGIVGQLKPRFAAQSACEIEGTFGAVGMMKDRLLGGADCDVLILTEALTAQLTASGDLAVGSARPLGVVKTGVAVKSGEAVPKVDTADALKAVLLGATGIYFPDPVKATAGIHFMKVLQSLGIEVELASRLRPFPNGATAMREMSQCAETGLVGCTQVTEIRYTPGVVLAGDLPKVFELATVYTAAVCAKAKEPELATALIDLLTGAEAAELRKSGGFE